MKKKFALLMTTALIGASLVGCGAKEEPSIETNPIVDESIIVEETTSEEDVNAVPEEEVVETEEIEIEEEEDGTIAEVETSETSDSNKNSPVVEKPVTETKPNNNKPSTNQNSSTNKPATENIPVVEESKPNTTPSTPETTPAVNTISADELYNKITADIEFPMQMEVDADMLSDVYGIDASLLKSFKVKMPMMSAHISEIGVFELKNESDVSKVIAGIEQRANNAGVMLYPSLQETYENRQIVTVGNYVLFVMDENVNIIVDNFKAALN